MRGLIASLTLALAGLATGCGAPPAPAASDVETAALPRGVVRPPVLSGAALSYLTGGQPGGRPVMLIHGTPGAATGWADYLRRVPAGLTYLAVDRPGFGSSGPEGAVTSLASQAAALVPLLPAEGRTILVGHSLGGPIALQAAVDMPGRIAAVVVVAGSLDPALERIHPMQPVGEWRLVRPLLPRAMRNANRELMALKPELERLAPRLAGVAIPVVIIHGTEDPLVPYANVDFMRRHLTRARVEVVTLAGRDHFLPWNSVPELEAAIARAVALAR